MDQHVIAVKTYLITVCLFALPNASESQTTGFLDRKLMLGDTVSQYQMYVPPNWSDEDSWPVILFLHGAGERGSDGVRQTEVGLGQVIRREPQRVPAIVAFPQCREGAQWSDPDMEQLAMMTIDRAIQQFKGDHTRVYLTGLSMGGSGTWYLAAKYPDRFAAIAPIAARALHAPRKIEASDSMAPRSPLGRMLNVITKRIAGIPTWAFHGREDPVIPVVESREMIAALRSMGNQPLYTEYDHIGHTSWNAAYAEPDFFPWLFSHRSRGRR